MLKIWKKSWVPFRSYQPIQPICTQIGLDTLLDAIHDFFQIFSIAFFSKKKIIPQTTFVPTFWPHIISELDSVGQQCFFFFFAKKKTLLFLNELNTSLVAILCFYYVQLAKDSGIHIIVYEAFGVFIFWGIWSQEPLSPNNKSKFNS